MVKRHRKPTKVRVFLGALLNLEILIQSFSEPVETLSGSIQIWLLFTYGSERLGRVRDYLSGKTRRVGKSQTHSN